MDEQRKELAGGSEAYIRDSVRLKQPFGWGKLDKHPRHNRGKEMRGRKDSEFTSFALRLSSPLCTVPRLLERMSETGKNLLRSCLR